MRGNRTRQDLRGRGRRTEVRSRRTEIGGRNAMQIKSAKDLRVYQKAYDLAMQIFEVTKSFPKEEKYALTDQIRRSSRSVCSNLREAWAKRRYAAHFISKLTDVDGENSETDTWLDFAKDCHYLNHDEHRRLIKDCYEIGAMLGAMLSGLSKFLVKDE